MPPSHIDIINSFHHVSIRRIHESNPGTSAAIALVKAAIEVFGLDDIFIKKETIGWTFRITLQNRNTLVFTRRELEQSASAIKLIPYFIADPDKQVIYDQILETANLCVCIMAISIMNNEGNRNFESALSVLKYLENKSMLPNLLGLENNFLKSRIWRNPENPGLIASLKNQTVYMSHGLWDNHGHPDPDVSLFPFRMQLIK